MTISPRPHFDTEDLRRRILIPDYLHARGWTLRGSDTKGWRGPCPVHKGDNREAFSVVPNGQRWTCFTHGCHGEHAADLISLVQAVEGLSFVDACRSLGGTANPHASPIQAPHLARPKPAPEPLPELDTAKRLEMEQMADRLAGDTTLIESIAATRGWEPATISALACTGALGWMDHAKGADAGLAFIYPHAVKVRGLWHDGAGGWRWHRRDGSKMVNWLWSGWAWNAAELWREDRIRLLLHDRIVITEGEPDTVTLIDAVANDFRTTVCAIPSATTSPRLKARLPDLVRGLHVRLAADNDAAGRKSAAELHQLLAPVASTISTLNL